MFKAMFKARTTSKICYYTMLHLYETCFKLVQRLFTTASHSLYCKECMRTCGVVASMYSPVTALPACNTAPRCSSMRALLLLSTCQCS